MRTYVLAALLVAGCSSSPSSSGGGGPSTGPSTTTTGATTTGGIGPCVDRNGTYSLKFTTRSGNCGSFSEQLVTIMPGLTRPGDGCSGTADTSPDNCKVTFDVACPVPMQGGTFGLQGVLTWSPDGASGAAVVEVTINDANGAFVCSGTYDEKYTRL